MVRPLHHIMVWKFNPQKNKHQSRQRNGKCIEMHQVTDDSNHLGHLFNRSTLTRPSPPLTSSGHKLLYAVPLMPSHAKANKVTTWPCFIQRLLLRAFIKEKERKKKKRKRNAVVNMRSSCPGHRLALYSNKLHQSSSCPYNHLGVPPEQAPSLHVSHRSFTLASSLAVIAAQSSTIDGSSRVKRSLSRRKDKLRNFEIHVGYES